MRPGPWSPWPTLLKKCVGILKKIKNLGATSFTVWRSTLFTLCFLWVRWAIEDLVNPFARQLYLDPLGFKYLRKLLGLSISSVSIMLSWSADAFLHRCEIPCEESMDKSTSVAKPTFFVNPTSKVAVSVLLCSVSCALSRKQNKWNRN